MLDSIKGEYLTKHRSYTMSVSITQAYIHDLVRNCLACLFFVPVSHGTEILVTSVFEANKSSAS